MIKRWAVVLAALVAAVIALPNPAHATVDFNRPFYLRAGGAVCPSMREMDMLAQGAPSNCRAVRTRVRAYLLSGGNAFLQKIHVRLDLGAGNHADVFVWASDLAN